MMQLRLTLDMVAAGPQGTAMALGLPVRVSSEENSILHQGRNIIRRADREDCRHFVMKPESQWSRERQTARCTAQRSHLQLLAGHGLQRHAEVERRVGNLGDLLERIDLRKRSAMGNPGCETSSPPTMHFLMILTPSMCAPVTFILR